MATDQHAYERLMSEAIARKVDPLGSRREYRCVSCGFFALGRTTPTRCPTCGEVSRQVISAPLAASAPAR